MCCVACQLLRIESQLCYVFLQWKIYIYKYTLFTAGPCLGLLWNNAQSPCTSVEHSQNPRTGQASGQLKKDAFLIYLLLSLVFFFTARMLWAVSSPACRPGSVASGGGSKWTLSFSADLAVKHQNFSCPDSFPCWQEMGALLKWCLHGVEAESCLKLLYHDSSDWGKVGTKRLETATYLAEED